MARIQSMSYLFFACLIPFLSILLNPSQARLPCPKEIDAEASKLFNWMVEFRRDLHMYPELGLREYNTSGKIAKRLTELNVRYTTGWGKNTFNVEELGHGGTGIVAEIGTGHYPSIGLRGDIDALPILESLDLSYRSKNDGVMHACGHDTHITMLLGAVEILKKYEAYIPGTIKFVFQPAEEGLGGARLMVDDGVLEKEPKIQEMYGVHIFPTLSLGTLSMHPSIAIGASHGFSVIIKGKGGHSAMPHLSIDPIPVAALIIQAYNNVKNRELFYQKEYAGIITITAFNAGEAKNVIPEEVEIIGSYRAMTKETHAYLKKRVQDIAKHISEAFLCTAEVHFYHSSYLPVHNDPTLVQHVFNWTSKSSYTKKTLDNEPYHLGGEDFCFFSEKVPSVFAYLGTAIGKDPVSGFDTSVMVHNPDFYFHEPAMIHGVAHHVNVALEALKRRAATMDNSKDEL